MVVAVWNGLVVVRTFILFHDHMHGALLSDSFAAGLILKPFGVLVMTPPNVWRETHNYHHAHTAKLVGSNIGSFPMMSTTQWAQASRAERLHYRLVRHPLTILNAYFTIFMLDMCLGAFLRAPRKNWDSLVSLLVNWGLSALLIWQFGVSCWLFGYFIPLFVACAVGAYLFYAQHNYPDTHIQPREQWAYARAALESSSYMETGKLLGWVTGNIGYHHVHHLNPSIPFYRLPEAMAAIPELKPTGKTSLAPRDIAECFRLKLWDPDQGRMVGFPQ
jgi:omega-6 fatty acid desaturase (delta-12 desaturase)